MNLHTTAALLTLSLALSAQAQSINFDDLVLNDLYIVGDTISSNGIDFEVVNFMGYGSTVVVETGGNALGSGLELFMGTLIGLDFQLPASTQGVSFKYGDFCRYGEPYCVSNIIVNGVTSPDLGSLVALNGTTIGGVLISATSNGAGNDQGQLIATGPINSFIIGGSSFVVDDVQIIVPEPATASLLCLGLLGIAIPGVDRKAERGLAS